MTCAVNQPTFLNVRFLFCTLLNQLVIYGKVHVGGTKDVVKNLVKLQRTNKKININSRHGDHGNYLFFATTGLKLSNTDTNVDFENLGNSTLVSYIIISSVLILGYVIDGREYIQESILEVMKPIAMSSCFLYIKITF